MKKASKKNHIIIPELIKKKSIIKTQSEKENVCNNLGSDEKINVLDYLQKEAPTCSQRSEEDLNKDIQPTGESTSRVSQSDSLGEESSIRSMMLSDTKKKTPELSRLQQLLYSQKMFINPDKWSQFMNKAMQDKQFHKALNVFLYSYFIQNYN